MAVIVLCVTVVSCGRSADVVPVTSGGPTTVPTTLQLPSTTSTTNFPDNDRHRDTDRCRAHNLYFHDHPGHNDRREAHDSTAGHNITAAHDHSDRGYDDR